MERPLRRRLQRRASYWTRKGRCNTLNCCMFLSLGRIPSKDKNMQEWPLRPAAGKLSRAASRRVACRTRRLTLRRPLPNHLTLDGFPGSWRCGGIIGNVTDGPKSGILIAADPATVERSGFAIGLIAGFLSIAWGNRRRFGIQPEKPLAWLRDQPGWTPLLLRIVRLSRNQKTPGR